MTSREAAGLGPEASARRARTRQVKELARSYGFDPVGITTADPFDDAERTIVERIHEGLMDGLPWYYESRARRGCHPTEIMPQAVSIISVGLNYHTPAPPEPSGDALRGRVSRYAWGRDYHKVFEQRLRALVRELRVLGGESARFYVDYGPIPDRAVAQRAGLGWYGKNTNLLAPGLGSWLFLGEVLTDLLLEPDSPLKKSCGSCVECIPACPTNAIPAPYVIDNTRCISYHTIENRGPIPRDLRPLMGDWVFGCDVCQDVCPVNHHSEHAGDPAFAAASIEDQRPDLLTILELDDEEFERRFRGSPVRRATRAGLQRNACVALGNAGDERAVPALRQALREGEALVRAHAAWALGRIGGATALEVLTASLREETDPEVLEELALALEALG